VTIRTLDLDHIAGEDRWEITGPRPGSVIHRPFDWLDDSTGTIVLWEGLDRVLPERRPQGGWARRRLELLAERTAEYLGIVFHRFLEDDAGLGYPVTIAVNGTKVSPWNPFAPYEAPSRPGRPGLRGGGGRLARERGAPALCSSST
jgi:hypothetical protein